MILLIDNFDSFVHNLARYLREMGCETRVVRNDSLTCAEIKTLQPSAIVLSPGPCTPDEAGISLDVVRRFSGDIPILGICLGHQAIGQALGGQVVRAPEPVHGRVSHIQHDERGLFSGLPNPLTVCRYHSLMLDSATLPSCFRVTARTTDGIIMGIECADQKLFGLQFHPEAILTQHGHALLTAFLNACGIGCQRLMSTELCVPPTAETKPPTNRVITF